MVLVCDKSKACSLCFSPNYLSCQESNIYFRPVVNANIFLLQFDLDCSWKTFHTFLVEQRDVMLFSYRNRLKSPPHFQHGSAALKVVRVRLHYKAPFLPTSFHEDKCTDWRFESMLPGMQIWEFHSSALVSHLIQNKTYILLFVHPSQPDS